MRIKKSITGHMTEGDAEEKHICAYTGGGQSVCGKYALMIMISKTGGRRYADVM